MAPDEGGGAAATSMLTVVFHICCCFLHLLFPGRWGSGRPSPCGHTNFWVSQLPVWPADGERRRQNCVGGILKPRYLWQSHFHPQSTVENLITLSHLSVMVATIKARLPKRKRSDSGQQLAHLGLFF